MSPPPAADPIASDDAVVAPAIVVSALGAALGGLLFGLDTAVISGAADALQREFALTNAALGFGVASALIGTVIGSAGGGRDGRPVWPPARADRDRDRLHRLRPGHRAGR